MTIYVLGYSNLVNEVSDKRVSKKPITIYGLHIAGTN